MSWLPVPERPTTSQVSRIFASSRGKSSSRMSGTPAAVVSRPASPSTKQPPISHAQWEQPLAKAQRPLARKPPATRFATPRGAKTPPAIASGGP